MLLNVEMENTTENQNKYPQMIVAQLQWENYSWNSGKLTNSLVWIILKMLAGILLDVFVTRLSLI